VTSGKGPGNRGRRNGITGASRSKRRRSTEDRSRASDRARGPERARGNGRSSGGDLTHAQSRGRGPGDKRSTRGPGPTRATAAPQASQRWTARLTGRAILLAAVVVLLVASLAYPLQRFLAQQADIDRLEAENSAAQQRVEDLRTQVDQLDDPAFIETQAQSRLQYVMPGDLLYVVDDSAAAQPLPGEEPVSEAPESPWFQQVLEMIDAADAGR